MNWKAIAIAAIAAEWVTIGCALVIRGQAKVKMKQAIDAVNVMGNCTDSCLTILSNDDLELEQKLERMIEQFQFVSLAIEESPTKEN